MTLKMNGYEVDVFEGEVVSQNTHHEAHISGGEIHQRYGFIASDPIRSETVTSDELYLRLKDGRETVIRTTGAFPYRVGHRLTVSQFRVGGSGSWYIGYAYNHNMKQFGQLGIVAHTSPPWTWGSFLCLFLLLIGGLMLYGLNFSGLWFIAASYGCWYIKSYFFNADQLKEPCKIAIDRYLAGERLDQGPPDQKYYC